jgi:NADH:ubiquinone oxidoreductase subunit F (NADH-binding)
MTNPAIPELLEQDPVISRVAQKTGVPEAQVQSAASFYHLLADPGSKIRVCEGLSCRLKGSNALLAAARDAGLPVTTCSCLAACDRAPAVLRDRRVLPDVTPEDMLQTRGNWRGLTSADGDSEEEWRGVVWPEDVDPDQLAIGLAHPCDWTATAFAKASEAGPEKVFDNLERADLRGFGGAGFPAHRKWRAVRDQAERTRYVVLNADEGDPGTFKDREVMVRRPDLVLEGLAIAAKAVGAEQVYLYLRGEFEIPRGIVEDAISRFADRLYPGISFHIHAGQGAYICGEETALLESLEGKRGMPRLKPPYPVEKGLWGKPTLIHNVETIACVPGIIRNGGDWYRALGSSFPDVVNGGTKLYCLSGHVARPGVYEMPLGVTLNELVQAAGGYVGEPKAFMPGGLSSGFLPIRMRDLPLDFHHLREVGSMLGSAGVVVLNDTVDMVMAAREALRFFENETCGQCTPCRIGVRTLGRMVEHHETGVSNLTRQASTVTDVAWHMREASICGLGQVAPLPLTSAMKYFPEEFRQ